MGDATPLIYFFLITLEPNREVSAKRGTHNLDLAGWGINFLSYAAFCCGAILILLALVCLASLVRPFRTLFLPTNTVWIYRPKIGHPLLFFRCSN